MNIENKRIKSYTLIFIIMLIVFIMQSVLIIVNTYKSNNTINNLSENLQITKRSYENLNETHNILQQTNDSLTTELIELQANYNELETELEKTQSEIQNNLEINALNGYTKLNATMGVNYYNGNKETYYNLPMAGVINIAKYKGIIDEYWVRDDGVKMYGDYIMVAANYSTYPYGSIVETSLGTGIVLDTGSLDENQFDIAVNW